MSDTNSNTGSNGGGSTNVNTAAVLSHLQDQEIHQADTSLSPVPADGVSNTNENTLNNTQLPSQVEDGRHMRSGDTANSQGATMDDYRNTMAPDMNRKGAQSGISATGRVSTSQADGTTNGALVLTTGDADSNVQLCGECGNEVATFECLDCSGEWYCRPCAIIVHSKGRRKSHAQFKEHPVCDICRSKLATLLCDKCDEVYCSTKCAYGAHDGSPRNGSKKRLHQWEALPNEGLPVQRPPHLEHAVDTRGGRNSFGIALTELTMARYDGIDEDFEEVDGFINEQDLVDGTRNQIEDDDDNRQGRQLLEMRDDNTSAGVGGGGNSLPISRLSNNQTPGVENDGQQQQQQDSDLVALSNALAGTQNVSDSNNNNKKKDDGLNAEERIAAGKATESHFASDSPFQNSRRARNEVHAAVAARNLPAPDLDEVVTLVTSATGGGGANGAGNNQSSAKNAVQNQGNSGALITNSVRGGKAAQLIVENGMTLIPPTEPVPERLLMAGLTEKLQAASEQRNAALMKKLQQGKARVTKLNEKIHGWRRWDFIRNDPAFFGTHPSPLIVNRPLPPLLPMIADLAADNDHENVDTGFPSYVPFFERSCGDDAFLLAVSSILASNGTQQVKNVRLEDGDGENGIFTPRIRGGPVINVVAPGFEGPQSDDRQKKKKALEKADAAQPCPIGNIFATIFASCERLHDLGLATFRFFKPTTGEDLALGAERHLFPHRAAYKATNGIPPPILEAVEHFVTVDTLFPVFEDGRPAFGRTDVPDEFWLTLLEKAYATMKGPEGYSALSGGSPADPLFSLCGGEPTQLQWGLQQLDSSAFAGGGADMVSPLAMRARVVGLAWWMLQVATQYNLPICVTKRHDESEKKNNNTTWYSLETGLDEVERFDWKGGDVVFFAVNHTVDRNLIDAQQYLDDEDDRSSAKSGATSNFNASFARSQMTGATGLSFGVGGGGRAIQSGKEEHRLLKLRQLYNTSRNNDKVASDSNEPLLPLWHDGSNKWSDIASRVSGTTGVAAFAARRIQDKLAKSVRSSKQSNQPGSVSIEADQVGSFSSASVSANNRRPPAGSSVKGYAESVLSRKDTANGGAASGASMWTKSTRKTLQHNVADERLSWMDVETFTQKYNTILIAQNMPQHKHHTFFGSIDMRLSETVIAKSLPHYLVVVEKRELENSDEADDRKWAEGLDSQFKSISDILKPPRNMKEDLGIGDKNETDDAAEEAAANNNNDDATSVASSQVSIAESLADMGTMGSRRSLVLRVTVTQPTTKVDLSHVVGPNNTASSANLLANLDKEENAGKGAASLMIEENQSMMDALSSFKSVMQPEELTLYAFRVSEPGRQPVTTSLGAKGEPVYSLPIHTKCPVNEIDDPIAIGQVPVGLHQVTFEIEANPGAYNFVVAPTRGMGRTDLGSSSVAQAHFSMHICAVRNGENYEVKAGRV